jgi:EpsI family protein
MLAVAPLAWDAAVERHHTGAPPELTVSPPPGWQAVSPAAMDWRPSFANPVSEWRGEFARDNKIVGVFIGYYRDQTYERKLVTSTNALVKTTDHAWRKVADAVRETSLGDQTVSVRTAELLGPAELRLVAWQWYWINDRTTGSDHAAKAWTALSRLFGQGDDSAVVVLYAPKGPAGEGEAALAAFAPDGYRAIQAALRRARDGA